ncbi:MAG: hypothetical protein ACE5G9_09455, partial [Nitrospinales bacterium]
MDENEKPEVFLEILRENSKTVRNTYITYLLLALFIWLTVEGVTHEQLLNPEIRISLPVIGVSLPVVGFFVVAPVLLFLFHLYFLLHVTQYAGQLAHAREQFEGKVKDWKLLLHGVQLTFLASIFNEQVDGV